MDAMLLIVAGAICVLLSGLMVYRLPPREGRPPSAWTRTETRAMASAMLTMILFCTGAVLVAKGIF